MTAGPSPKDRQALRKTAGSKDSPMRKSSSGSYKSRLRRQTLPEEHTPTGDPHKEQIFLEGPRSRTRELLEILSIMLEFIRGFRVLHFVGPCVTVFGSARFAEDSPYYKLTREVGRR